MHSLYLLFHLHVHASVPWSPAMVIIPSRSIDDDNCVLLDSRCDVVGTTMMTQDSSYLFLPSRLAFGLSALLSALNAESYRICGRSLLCPVESTLGTVVGILAHNQLNRSCGRRFCSEERCMLDTAGRFQIKSSPSLFDDSNRDGIACRFLFKELGQSASRGRLRFPDAPVVVTVRVSVTTWPWRPSGWCSWLSAGDLGTSQFFHGYTTLR